MPYCQLVVLEKVKEAKMLSRAIKKDYPNRAPTVEPSIGTCWRVMIQYDENKERISEVLMNLRYYHYGFTAGLRTAKHKRK